MIWHNIKITQNVINSNPHNNMQKLRSNYLTLFLVECFVRTLTSSQPVKTVKRKKVLH